MSNFRQSKIIIILMALLTLSIAIPSFKHIEEIYKKNLVAEKSFTSSEFNLPLGALNSPIAEIDLVEFLSSSKDIPAVRELIDYLNKKRQNISIQDKQLIIKIVANDKGGKDSLEFLYGQSSIYFFARYNDLNIFQNTELNTASSGLNSFDLWQQFQNASSTEEQQELFNRLKNYGKIYSLNKSGIFRIIQPNSSLQDLDSDKNQVVAVSSPETFETYSAAGTLVNLSNLRPEFITWSRTGIGTYQFIKTREFITGYDSDLVFLSLGFLDQNNQRFAILIPLRFEKNNLNKKENCIDGIDNNEDGWVDCNDQQCVGTSECPGYTVENCNNGIDDNFNGDTDCNDQACNQDPSCQQVTATETPIDSPTIVQDPPAEICSNNFDDDGNNLTDCADLNSCENDPYCQVHSQQENCSNGIDDDYNGLVDCNDYACSYEWNCTIQFPLYCYNYQLCSNGDSCNCYDAGGWCNCDCSTCPSNYNYAQPILNITSPNYDQKIIGGPVYISGYAEGDLTLEVAGETRNLYVWGYFNEPFYLGSGYHTLRAVAYQNGNSIEQIIPFNFTDYYTPPIEQAQFQNINEGDRIQLNCGETFNLNAYLPTYTETLELRVNGSNIGTYYGISGYQSFPILIPTSQDYSNSQNVFAEIVLYSYGQAASSSVNFYITNNCSYPTIEDVEAGAYVGDLNPQFIIKFGEEKIKLLEPIKDNLFISLVGTPINLDTHNDNWGGLEQLPIAISTTEDGQLSIKLNASEELKNRSLLPQFSYNLAISGNVLAEDGSRIINIQDNFESEIKFLTATYNNIVATNNVLQHRFSPKEKNKIQATKTPTATATPISSKTPVIIETVAIKEICDNRFDDDQDGTVDCGDNDCICNDFPEDCENPGDEDRNGVSDCEDPSCKNQPSCRNINSEICNNNIDDDENGATDCIDEACWGDTRCMHGDPEFDCSNNVDDDNNGRIDCQDPFCQQMGQCPEPTPTEVSTEIPTLEPTQAISCPSSDFLLKYAQYLKMTPEERLAAFTPDELYEFAMRELASTGLLNDKISNDPPDCSCSPGTTAKLDIDGWSCSCSDGEFYDISLQACRNKLDYCNSVAKGSIVNAKGKEWSCDCPTDLVFNSKTKSCETRQLYCSSNIPGSHFVDYNNLKSNSNSKVDEAVSNLRASLYTAKSSSTEVSVDINNFSPIYSDNNNTTDYGTYSSTYPDYNTIDYNNSDNQSYIDSVAHDRSSSTDLSILDKNSPHGIVNLPSGDKNQEQNTPAPTWGCECAEYFSYQNTDSQDIKSHDAVHLNSPYPTIIADSQFNAVVLPSEQATPTTSDNSNSESSSGACLPIVYDCSSIRASELSFIPQEIQALEQQMYDADLGDLWKQKADENRINLHTIKGTVPPGSPSGLVQRCDCPNGMEWNKDQESCVPKEPEDPSKPDSCDDPEHYWKEKPDTSGHANTNKNEGYVNDELHGNNSIKQYECVSAPTGMYVDHIRNTFYCKPGLALKDGESGCFPCGANTKLVEKDEQGLILDYPYCKCSPGYEQKDGDDWNSCTHEACPEGMGLWFEQDNSGDEPKPFCKCKQGWLVNGSCTQCPNGGTYNDSTGKCYQLLSGCEYSMQLVPYDNEVSPSAVSCPSGTSPFTKLDISGGKLICCSDPLTYDSTDGSCKTPSANPEPDLASNPESPPEIPTQAPGIAPLDPSCLEGYEVRIFNGDRGCCPTGYSFDGSKCSTHEDKWEQVETCSSEQEEEIPQNPPSEEEKTPAGGGENLQAGSPPANPENVTPSEVDSANKMQNPPPPQKPDIQNLPKIESPTSEITTEAPANTQQDIPVFETQSTSALTDSSYEIEKKGNPNVAQSFNEIEEKIPNLKRALDIVKNEQKNVELIIKDITERLRTGVLPSLTNPLGPTQADLERLNDAIQRLNDALTQAWSILSANQNKLSFKAYISASIILNSIAESIRVQTGQFFSDIDTGLNGSQSRTSIIETGGWSLGTALLTYWSTIKGSKHGGALSVGLGTIAAEKSAEIAKAAVESARTGEDVNAIISRRMEDLNKHVYADGIMAWLIAEALVHLKEALQYRNFISSPEAAAEISKSIQDFFAIYFTTKLSTQTIDAITNLFNKAANNQEIAQADIDAIFDSAAGWAQMLPFMKALGIKVKEPTYFEFVRESTTPTREDITINRSELNEPLGNGVTREAFVNPLNPKQVIVIGHNYDPIKIPESKPTRENAESYYNHVKDLANAPVDTSNLKVRIATPNGVARVYDSNGNPTYGVIMERAPNNLYDYVKDLPHTEHTRVLEEIHSKLLDAINAYAEKGYILKDLNAENIGYDPISKEVIIFDLNECVTPNQLDNPSSIGWLEADELSMSRPELFNHLVDQSITKTNRLFNLYKQGVGVPSWQQ